VNPFIGSVSFNLISTDLEPANLRIASRTIDIDGYGVDVDGSGSVSGSDELDFSGVAQITTKRGFFTNTFARLSGATLVVKDHARVRDGSIAKRPEWAELGPENAVTRHG
jgi:autotransporter translocation and assembly factor TamB